MGRWILTRLAAQGSAAIAGRLAAALFAPGTVVAFTCVDVPIATVLAEVRHEHG
jgi:hypothetical protein